MKTLLRSGVYLLSLSFLAASQLVTLSSAKAGYVEINKVGDKRESYRVNEVKSTATDSKVPQKESQKAVYYTPKK